MANNKSTLYVATSLVVVLLALTFNVALSKQRFGQPCLRDTDCDQICKNYTFSLCISSKCSCGGPMKSPPPPPPPSNQDGLKSVKKVCNVDAQCKPLCKVHDIAECIGHKCFCSGVEDGAAPAEAPSEEGLKAVRAPACNRDEQCNSFCPIATYPQCISHRCDCFGST